MIPKKKVPTEHLRNQSEIDAHFSEAKMICDYRLEEAKKMLTCIYHVHVFEAGFNRVSQDPKDSHQNERVCWCPCNKQYKHWHNTYQCDYEEGDNRKICDNKSFTPQGLINHLGAHRIQYCYYHRLFYLYLKHLYGTNSDNPEVSGRFEFKFQNKYCFNFVNR